MIWFRPWMAWALAVAALMALLGLQSVRLADAKADIATESAAHQATKAAHALALAEAVTKARKTETDLRADLDRQQADATKEKEDAEKREADLIERVRTGERRLYVAAKCPSSAGSGLRSPSTGGSGAEVARAELEPAAASRILGIGADGDRNTRERNACVAAYEAVRTRLNAAAAR